MPDDQNDEFNLSEDPDMDEKEQDEQKEPETPEEKVLKMLLDEIDEEGDTNNGDEESSDEGIPIDTDEKFITPDMVELPPKWFYEKIKDADLPRGMRLTDNMKKILDLIYLQGVSKRRLIREHNISASSISTTFQRIRKLWGMHLAGTLNLEPPEAAVSRAESKVQARGSSASTREQALSSKTTTFKEVDLAISKFLAPQIERSTQFQDVMARIGMMTTYTLMQLGVVDRTQFVNLAEAVTADPENLYTYVASSLSTLISVVDLDQLKAFTKELMRLRETNRLLENHLVEVEEDLERHKTWLHEAGLLISYMMDRLPYKDKLDVMEMMVKYEKARQLQRGEVIAKSES